MFHINRFERFRFFNNTAPPAAPGEIARLESRLSLVIPDIHKEFLAMYNGANTNCGILYGVDDISEMYEANQLAGYTPGYVCIGGDNGDYEFLMQAKADAQAVYVIDAGALAADDIRAGRVCAMASIFDWLMSEDGEDPGDPLALFEGEDDGAFHALVDVELLRLPSGGSAALYSLLSDLGLAVSPRIVMEYQKTPLPLVIAKNKLLREMEPRMGQLKEPGIVRIIHKES